jgi:hypothetical protein
VRRFSIYRLRSFFDLFKKAQEHQISSDSCGVCSRDYLHKSIKFDLLTKKGRGCGNWMNTVVHQGLLLSRILSKNPGEIEDEILIQNENL